MNRLEESLEDFKNALSLDNKNPIIYSNMGLYIIINISLVLRKMEDYESAIYCYT